MKESKPSQESPSQGINKFLKEIICDRSDQETGISKSFEGKKIPKISQEEYIERLRLYMKFEESSLILSIVYLDRFCTEKGVKITARNFHRLFLISLVTAIKYSEDLNYSNLIYSKIGGVKLTQFNEMECEFLNGLNWKLFVGEEEFTSFQYNLYNKCPY
jgi:hypothetical protein